MYTANFIGYRFSQDSPPPLLLLVYGNNRAFKMLKDHQTWVSCDHGPARYSKLMFILE